MFEEQEGCCAICGKHSVETSNSWTDKLHIDHCHATGIVRALLCHRCNNMLGCCNDEVEILEKAVKYLGRFNDSNRERVSGVATSTNDAGVVQAIAETAGLANGAVG